MQAPGGGGEQGWLGLATKLEFYCCSSYYVTHPIKGDILQNPVVIINNHLPPTTPHLSITFSINLH